MTLEIPVLKGFEVITLVVIGTGCTGSCKSNYHRITTMTSRLRGWTNSLSDVQL